MAREIPNLRTPRLLLRPWRPEDRLPFAELNADLLVVEHLPGALSSEASARMADRIQNHFAVHGFGLWAIEAVGEAPFIGFAGLAVPNVQAHFSPCVEIGWRLAHEHWGRGFATEAARAAMEFGFRSVQLKEIVSFTVPANARSRRVMEKLAMTHDAGDDFDHPAMPVGHRLQRHVLYRMSEQRWSEINRG